MLTQIRQKLHNSRIFIALLLCVFVTCWGSSAKIWQNVLNLSTTATVTYTAHTLAMADTQKSTIASQSDGGYSANTERCDKTSYLITQAQQDLSDFVAILFIVLLLFVSVFRTQKPLKLKPFWRPKRRTHSVFCCFLE